MKTKQASKNVAIIPDERIIGKIYYLRGKKVMLDRDLAELYNVTTGNLNKAVKRNLKRFPEDFMFQLNEREADILRYQSGTLEKSKNLRFQNGTSSYGGRRYLPYVFTEQGVMMLSAVLHSDIAIEVSIQIVRIFIKLREMLLTHKDLQNRIEKMDKENKENFKIIFKVLAKLMKTEPRDNHTNRIGFKT